ncbi:MAG TPA: hypothetical protein VK066_29720 [Chloroflexota bacterium]|nr:hypothetical protein [Chloroflexota bacterium]
MPDVEYCPTCGYPIPTTREFGLHLRQVARDEAHVATVWTLLGIDYAAMKAAEREELLERARERGWRVL